jgi:hypothetical protein
MLVHMSKLSLVFLGKKIYLTFRYHLSAGVINTGEHFIALIKSNNNVYYLFDDLTSESCSIHNGRLRIDFALYVLKV